MAASERRRAGAVKSCWRQPAAGVDVRHQTLAGRPETRRGSAEPGGCAAAAWQSGADDPAGTDGEPEGARALAIAVLLLPFICRQPLHNRSRRKTNVQGRTMKSRTRIGRIKCSGRWRRGCSGSAAGASAFPGPRRGLPFFFGRAGDQGLSTAPVLSCPVLSDRRPSLVQTSVDPTHCAPR